MDPNPNTFNTIYKPVNDDKVFPESKIGSDHWNWNFVNKSDPQSIKIYLRFRFSYFQIANTMYYAHPLISYPSSSSTNLGQTQSPVLEGKKKKRADCNDILLTVLFTLYGALHLAVAVLALFLIQVKYWPASQCRLNSVN